MNKTIGILMLLLFTACFIGAQDKTSISGGKEDKAKEILEKARKAIGKKINVQDVRGLTISTEESFQLSIDGRKSEGTQKIETSFVLPDKIYQTTVGDYSTNQQSSKYILNGDKFSSKLDIFVNGQRQEFSSIVGEKSLISSLKYKTFLLLFPVTLDASWYVPLKFEYVGIAESKDGKAEVLEAVSPGKTAYRIFFDAKTFLPLMLTESWTNKENKSFENKYFYSDYRESDGLLAATRIVVEKNGTVAEEKTIKNLKVNPVFKPDFFDAK
jgi:hypothetical protein